MHHRVFKFLIILATSAVLAACEGTVGTQEGETAGSEVGAATDQTTEGTGSMVGVEPTTGFQGHPLDDPDSLLSKRTIYFDFDKSEIKDEFRPILEAHASYLSNNPSASVTLEGHADERGTREYNMALGERRANSARQFMTLMGGAGQQIRTVSYGEERPVAEGHNEEAWALNRRVEIIYRTR